MSLPAKISVIVTTYNNPQFLEMVLRSLVGQRRSYGCPVYEVVVADDGSGPETAEMLARLRPQLDYELLHIWHPDDGFRVAAARNNALTGTTGDYVVFIDGDCLAPAGFVATHARLAETGCFLAGARSYIKQRQTRKMLAEPERWARPERFPWFSGPCWAMPTAPSSCWPCRGMPCVTGARISGRWYRPAISGSGAPISTGWTATTCPMSAMALKIRTLPCGCCAPASGANQAGLAVLSCICGIPARAR